MISHFWIALYYRAQFVFDQSKFGWTCPLSDSYFRPCIWNSENVIMHLNPFLLGTNSNSLHSTVVTVQYIWDYCTSPIELVGIKCAMLSCVSQKTVSTKWQIYKGNWTSPKTWKTKQIFLIEKSEFFLLKKTYWIIFCYWIIIVRNLLDNSFWTIY